MKRILFTLAVLTLLVPASAMARKVTYIYDNHRFNYVRLEEVKPDVAAKRNMTQPVDLDEQGLRTALASVNLSHSYIIKKEVDTQQVFDEEAINFLAPYLKQAFAKAKPNEEVQFSYLMKQPILILRNDRLNLGSAWISGNELHMKFDKLYAKVLGDTDKRGNEAKAVAKAQGLRVKLEMGPGQKMGIDDPEELVLDINYNYAKDQKKDAAPIIKTMAGETISAPAPVAAPADTSVAQTEQPKGKKSKKAEKADAKAQADKNAQASAAAAAAPAVKGPQERLQQLDDLKKQGLINKKEYDAKRQEILKDL